MPDICQTRTDFTLPSFSGGNVSLSDYDGKVILLSLMGLQCGHCHHWMDHMQQIQNDYASNPDVQLVGVFFDSTDNVTSSQDVQNMINNNLGFTPTFPILMADGSDTSVNQYFGGLSSPTIYPVQYIISKNSIVANKWHTYSTTNGDEICFDSSDKDDTEYFVRHRLDDLQTTKQPWDTVLVLDYSGSMNGNVTINGVTQPKIDFLREASSTMAKVWKDYALCQDKIGVVYFKSDPTSGGALQTILPGANVTTLIGNIETELAGGCTAMGGGLATALDILGSSASEKYIILFSDGMQNRNPLVYELSNELRIDNIGPANYPAPLVALCGGNNGQSNYSGTLPIILENLSTPIHTIGIGAPAAWQTMLQEISQESSGEFKADIDIWPNLKEYFIETLVELYRGNSLQVVSKKQGTLAAANPSQIETFLLNKSVKKATILLSWVDRETPLTFKLKKDGVPINLSNKVTEDESYRFATILFPHYQTTRVKRPVLKPLIRTETKMVQEQEFQIRQISASPRLMSYKEILDADGKWEIEIQRTFSGDGAPASYHLMVLADDKGLEYDFKLPRRVYSGEPIPMSVMVLDNGKPVEKIFSARAIIHRPTKAFGELLSKYRINKDLIDLDNMPLETQGNPLYEKLEIFMRDEEVLTALRNFELERVSFERVWKTSPERRSGIRGLLKGVSEKTSIPGFYQIDFRIRGVGTQSGIFERTESRTVLVYPKLDRELTVMESVYNEKARQLVVTLTPTDINGAPFGPGYARQILCMLDDETAGHVTDNHDGSYKLEIDLPKGKTMGRLKSRLEILGEKTFEGKLSELGKK
jgi:peroxiredoxin